MPAVTALREVRGGKVAVELDGARWRVLPADAVVRAGLAVGLELDRPRLRELRRALRGTEARARALRALASRDRSRDELDARLRRAGFAADERTKTLGALERAGLVDDDRFAATRAAALARREWGDEAIRTDLARHGVAPDTAEAALAGLDPEPVRAAAVVARLGPGARAARRLAARGFDEGTVSDAAGADEPEALE